MNDKIFKDKKVLLGITMLIIFSATAIILSVYEISYWVLFTILSMFILYRTLGRIDKIMKK